MAHVMTCVQGTKGVVREHGFHRNGERKTIRIAATANVIRIPVATASGCAVVMSIVPDASAKTAPIRDAPVKP
jgi:hypothetical protein